MILNSDIQYGLTAISRSTISAPLRYLINSSSAFSKHIKHESLYHCGSGKAYQDSNYLKSISHQYTEYDPYHGKHQLKTQVHTIIVCFYVLNILPKIERTLAWETLANSLDSSGSIYLAVRCDNTKGKTYQDGVITKRNTFQVRYSEQKLIHEAKNTGLSTTILHKTSGYILSNHRRNLI